MPKIPYSKYFKDGPFLPSKAYQRRHPLPLTKLHFVDLNEKRAVDKIFCEFYSGSVPLPFEDRVMPRSRSIMNDLSKKSQKAFGFVKPVGKTRKVLDPVDKFIRDFKFPKSSSDLAVDTFIENYRFRVPAKLPDKVKFASGTSFRHTHGRVPTMSRQTFKSDFNNRRMFEDVKEQRDKDAVDDYISNYQFKVKPSRKGLPVRRSVNTFFGMQSKKVRAGGRLHRYDWNVHTLGASGLKASSSVVKRTGRNSWDRFERKRNTSKLPARKRPHKGPRQQLGPFKPIVSRGESILMHPWF